MSVTGKCPLGASNGMMTSDHLSRPSIQSHTLYKQDTEEEDTVKMDGPQITKPWQSPQTQESREGFSLFQNLTLGLMTLNSYICLLFLWEKKKKSRNFTKTIPDLRKLFVAATTRSISSKTKMWKCTFSFTEFPQSNSQTYLQQPLALSPGGTKVTTSRPSVQHSSTNTYWLAQSKQVTFTPQMNLEV